MFKKLKKGLCFMKLKESSTKIDPIITFKTKDFSKIESGNSVK